MSIVICLSLDELCEMHYCDISLEVSCRLLGGYRKKHSYIGPIEHNTYDPKLQIRICMPHIQAFRLWGVIGADFSWPTTAVQQLQCRRKPTDQAGMAYSTPFAGDGHLVKK